MLIKSTREQVNWHIRVNKNSFLNFTRFLTTAEGIIRRITTMTSLCPVRLLISLALLSLVTGFTPQSAATIRQRRRVFIADHQRHFVAENEKTMLAASKASRPTQTRRDSIQKLITRPVAALAATWITNNPWFTTKASASEAQSTPLLPETSAVLDPTVLTLIKGAKTIYIVGTAHISAVSADLAGRLVRETTPDAVFVELDAARLSRAFKGGIPPPGVSVAIHDDAGNLRVGVTQKPTITQRLAIKLVNALTNPTMYRKLEMAGISVGEEVSMNSAFLTLWCCICTHACVFDWIVCECR